MAKTIWRGNPAAKGHLVPLDELRADPENPNDHTPPESIPAIAASLVAYGQQKNAVHRPEDEVPRRMVAGSGMLEAARSVGWTHLWSLPTDLDPIGAAGYSIADNLSARHAEPHLAHTAALLQGIQDAGRDTTPTGYDAQAVEALLGRFGSIDPAGDGGGGSLPSSDDDMITVTFTLHVDQNAVLQEAVKAAKAAGDIDDPRNENANGNAIAAIAAAYLDGHAV